MKSLRIAMLTYSLRPRGGVVHALEVAEALARRGHEVALMALGGPGESFFREPEVPFRIVRYERLERIHSFFERWGTFAIFICRFLPVIRGIVGIPAGIAEMNLAHFYLWTFLGSAIFCSGFIVLGYAFGDHLDAILPLIHKGGLAALIAVVVLGIAVYFIMRARGRPKGGVVAS